MHGRFALEPNLRSHNLVTNTAAQTDLPDFCNKWIPAGFLCSQDFESETAMAGTINPAPIVRERSEQLRVVAAES